MIRQYFHQGLGSLLAYSDHIAQHQQEFRVKEKLLHILWNRGEQTQVVEVDAVPIALPPNHVMTTTYLQQVCYPKQGAISSWSFNREFYCILDHDAEVSCNGIIFLGTQSLAVLALDEDYQRKLDTLLAVFLEEFGTQDNIQGEMLQMLLKRLIILVTRLARTQSVSDGVEGEQLDIIRKFNVLVDLHYKQYKQVADYADLLFKSPKTLSNLFAKYNQKTPLQIIHERIALEAKRLLLFSDLTVKEIAFTLGYRDVAAFNKLVKKHLGSAPATYRKVAVQVAV